jgi:hypothetical protein
LSGAIEHEAIDLDEFQRVDQGKEGGTAAGDLDVGG